jgi:hypothetical protein
MDKVHKPITTKYYTPSSKYFRIYWRKFIDTVVLRGIEILFILEERTFHSAVDDSVFA